MKTLVLLTALLAGYATARAQQPVSALTVPIGLGEGAGAVLRTQEQTFTVRSPGEALETVHTIVTVLNEKGQDQATLVVPYDKLSRVSDIEGVLYDAAGKVVRRLKRADIKDLSAISDGSLFEDQRLKVAAFNYAEYPFTVEFRYERTSHNLLFYPDWFPVSDPDLAVESARLQIVLPAGQSLRYRLLNGLPEPAVTDEAAGRSYVWQFNSHKVRERESYNHGYSRLGPGMKAAPADFELDTYKGSARTWQELGRFMYNLNANRDQLPEATRAAVADQVRGETDLRKKVEKVYAFMQKHTRYVSIQLGIGGWQTFPATMVAEKGYGDCKALSNYTGALLKAVGIPSYAALVKAGDDKPDVLTDFPAAQFNHVVLCVPLAKDTLWLECTSQLSAPGYMGSFTGNRHALLLTPEGGRLVRTPAYRPADSRLIRRIDLTIDGSGDASAEVLTRYTGPQAEIYQAVLHEGNPEQQKQWLYKQIQIPSYEIRAFSFAERPAPLPTVDEKLSLHIRNGANRSGTRLFLNPNLLSALRTVPTGAEERKTEFQLPLGYVDVDTVVCRLPPHTVVEALFSPVQHTAPFGSYSASIRQEGDKLIYVRRLQMEGGTFPATAYAAYIAFRQKLVKYDRMQVVLKEAGGAPVAEKNERSNK